MSRSSVTLEGMTPPATRPAASLSVGVSILILNERGEVLPQQRGDDRLWGTPGGGLEPGETFLAAAHRELQEETGLTCPPWGTCPLLRWMPRAPTAAAKRWPSRGSRCTSCRP